jgi:hypothetical protein
MTLSSKQRQITMAIAPKISSFLSVLADLWIAIEVLTHSSGKNKRSNPYHRLLLAMSGYDMAASVWNFASTWPMPRGSHDTYASSGTQATCTVQGYFVSLGIAVPMYNAFLSLYYLLAINLGHDNESIRHWIEPTMHVVAFLLASGVSTYSATTGLLNASVNRCWIASFPDDCLDSWRYGDEGNCIRGDNAWLHRWAFYFGPLLLCLIITGKYQCILLCHLNCFQLSNMYRNPLISMDQYVSHVHIHNLLWDDHKILQR